MGTPNGPVLSADTAIRLLLRRTTVEPERNCWIWRGSLMTNGYRHTQWNGRVRPTHRVTYEHYFGSVPDGQDLDHLCRVRACCNPFHLEPVTRRENSARSPFTFKATCPAGHEMSGSNVYERLLKNGRICRYCRACNREAARRLRL